MINMSFLSRSLQTILAELRMSRSKSYFKSRPRNSRGVGSEPLEVRHPLTAAIYWDPTAAASAHESGTGNWHTTNVSGENLRTVAAEA
jgi:hypothetical protein